MQSKEKTAQEWASESAGLRARLDEAEETLRAIREGEVDSLLISTTAGQRIYTLEGADHTYRILVESMQQGAATLLEDGSIFYSNQHLARILKTPLEQLIGASIHTFVHPADAPQFAALIEQGRKCSSEGELRFQAADGTSIPVYLAFNRLQLDGKNSLCLAVTDLTATAAAQRLAQANAKLKEEVAERKLAEKALRKANKLLEAQKEDLQALAEELQSQTEELQSQAEELQSQAEELQAQYEELHKANHALEESRAQLEAIVQQMPAGVIVAEAPSGRVILGNTAMERILRRHFISTVNLSGYDQDATIHPESWVLQDRELLLPRALQGDKVTNHEIQILRGDGSQGIVNASSAPIRDAEGRISGAIVVLEDITERKRVEEALRESWNRFQVLTQNLQSGVALIDAQGKFSIVNPSFLRLFDLPDETDIKNINDRNWGEWHVFDEQGTPLNVDEHPVRKAAMTGRAVRNKLVGIRTPSSEELKWMLISVEPILKPDGLMDALICTYHDITELRQKEAKLSETNEQLLDADRHKDEFLAMLAHELRNPLAPVRNAVQILRAVGARDQVTQRQHDTIDRQVRHMARLLDDLLDVSRVTSGKIVLEKQPLPLIDVLAHALEIAAPLIQNRRHELMYSPPTDVLLVEGDLDRLAQVFGNILTNAAKYTEEGGRIWLEASRLDGQVEVRVRDNGVGIEPKLQPHVFDLFTQADHSLGRAQSGLGIGLTMVRNLVRMHGGTVEVRSAGLGQGSEFIVRLPAISSEPASEIVSRADPIEPAAEAMASCRVMIVDDVIDSAESLAELIAIWGHTTRAAHSGAAALELAREFQPNVALLDIGMPGMDGFELARCLRAKYEGKLVLVALTGYGQTQDRQLTREAGFDHHLVKPVDLEALRGMLAHVHAL